MISRQKLDSFRRTSQSQPGCSQPRHIDEHDQRDRRRRQWRSRTASGSVAHERGSGQRARNRRASKSDAGFPRPGRRLMFAPAASSRTGRRRRPVRLAALTVAGSIELGFHSDRGDMDVTGGGVDVGVTEQGLHHRQVDTGFGERGAERVPQRVRVTAGHAGQFPVIAEHPPQPLQGERLATGRALGDDEQPAARPSRAVRPADRSGSPRRRRHRAGHDVPCRLCRRPTASGRRYRHR